MLPNAPSNERQTVLGFRHRLNRGNLPRYPDLTFFSKRKVIFVHGCFWHVHDDYRNARIPKSNQLFWLTKLAANKLRDCSNMVRLVKLGWNAQVLWECELGALETTASKVRGLRLDNQCRLARGGQSARLPDTIGGSIEYGTEADSRKAPQLESPAGMQALSNIA